MRYSTLTLLMFVAIASWATRALAEPIHPRLLFGPEDVPALRAKVLRPPFSDMLLRMKHIVDDDPDITGNPGVFGKDSHILAVRNAFLYIFTGTPSYAVSARRHVEGVLELENWANPNVKGLRLYAAGTYVAFAYDLCYQAPSWDPAFRARVAKALREQHEVIFTHGGREQNRNPASNWQGLRWSSAGILAMVLNQEDLPEQRLKECHQRVETFLSRSMGGAEGTRGWGIEGLGYTYYPMGNGVAQYVLAAKRYSSEFDLTTHPGLQMSLWSIYAALIPSSRGLFRPDFGDDNPNARGEACYGFAFALCPPELLPGLKFWYDRTVGAKGNRTFDDTRFGLASSLLYYPADLQARDPMTIPEWRAAFLDTEGIGMQTWRNRYQGPEDLVVQLYAKLRGDEGHSGPDALSFRIAGMNTLWATGGGRYKNWGALSSGVEHKKTGKNVYRRSMNTLYPVDPDDTLQISGQSGRILGTPLVREDGSGWCVMAIDKNNVGTDHHTRRFITDFQAGADVACIISDTSDNGRYWQLVTLGDNRVTTQENTFTITSPSGDTMKGTVLYPRNPVFHVGKRSRGSKAFGETENGYIHFSSEDGDYLVVLTIAKRGRSHPPVYVKGQWSDSPDGMIRVGPAIYKIQGDTITRRP